MLRFISVLLIMVLFCSCTVEIRNPNEENISSGDAVLSEEDSAPDFEQNPGESCTLPEDAGNNIPAFGDFDSIYIYEEDSSPLVAFTEEEKTEFLEIISSYALTEIDEADPLIGTKGGAVIITGEEKGAALYSNEHAGEGLLYMKWNKSQDEKAWEVSGDLYFDLADFRNRVRKNARNDGRWPFFSYEEESYIQNLPDFDEEHFRSEFDIFIGTVSGEHSIESQRLGVEKAGTYSIVKAYRNGTSAGKEYGFDDDGRALIPEEEIDRVAKYVFGIDGYSGLMPSENGFYTVPFHTAYINYAIESIETDGSYVICTVNYYDLGDTEHENALCQKVFRFIFFEAEGETWYRPTSAYYVFGGEYGF
ncbi:MAG: hypothetical protein IJ300_12005 [Clostridia bacterium]|nr:hypothetical protein [Clostridia bacterium]